jgi:hypothetical protein
MKTNETGMKADYGCENCGQCPAGLKEVKRTEEKVRPKETGMTANQDGESWSNCPTIAKDKGTGIKV